MPARSFRNARPLTHFAIALESAIARSGLSLVQIAEQSGVSHTSISRLRSGAQLTINPEHMAAILPIITGESQRQAELVRAHLQDHLYGPGSEQIEIRIRGHAKADDRQPTEYEQALAHLDGLARKNRDFAHWIITQARWFGLEAPQQAHAKVPAEPGRAKQPHRKPKAPK
jgi:transcriptional regulator with XRE-family HTH domain